MLLAPGSSVKCRTIFRKTAVTVQPWSSGHGVTFSFFYKTIPRRVRVFIIRRQNVCFV